MYGIFGIIRIFRSCVKPRMYLFSMKLVQILFLVIFFLETNPSETKDISNIFDKVCILCFLELYPGIPEFLFCDIFSNNVILRLTLKSNILINSIFP